MSDLVIGEKQNLVNVANAIRNLIGSGEMSVNGMINNINDASSAVNNALSALVEKGVEVPDGTKVDGLAAMITAIEYDPNKQYIPYEKKKYNYTVNPIPGASFGFTLNENGYYESQNKSMNSSYAICRINLVVDKECDISIDVINYAEPSYDYGLFGNLNTALALGSSADSDVKMNFKTKHSLDIVTLTYENVPIGNHFIDVKFIKDSSNSKNNDSIQFRFNDVGATFVDEKYYPIIQTLSNNLKPENVLSGVDIFGIIGTVIQSNPEIIYKIGSFTIAEDTNTYEIQHNFEQVPNFAVLFYKGYFKISGNVSRFVSEIRVKNLAFHAHHRYGGSVGGQQICTDYSTTADLRKDPVNSFGLCLANESTITYNCATYPLVSGNTYTWIIGVI